MLYSVKTKLDSEKAVEEAIKYFKGGLGLELVEREECCAYFEGGGGHVRVTATPENKETTVELETREWDRQVKQFMRQVA